MDRAAKFGWNRRAFLTAATASVMTGNTPFPALGGPIPSDAGWPTGTLADAGFVPHLGERLDARFAAGDLDGLHAVLVARHGTLVLERYYPGEDESWGRPLGTVAFGPEVRHDLRSVTKSVVGLLYGIALAEGAVPSLDTPLVELFPEYPDLAGDPVRRRMTVAHALTMTLGTEWNEELSYADPRNSERAMEAAADRYRFILDRPMVSEPGTRWTYNGGATALLGGLIARGTGTTLRDFAERALFSPLGIRDVEWIQGSDGAFAAASGLRLRPRDLAKIGQLALDGGRRDDIPIVPADWLAASFTPHASTGELQYGYQWWLGPAAPDGRPGWIAGFGNGGQRLFLGPRLGVIVLVLAGRYNQPDAWTLPVRVITEIVLPGLARR